MWSDLRLLHVIKNDQLAETYIHEPGGTCPLLRDDGTVHYILPDRLDAPSEEIGTTGELEWVSEKGTWGEGFRGTGAGGGEPALGQWHDPESGLHYNFFRYYDPELGRYLSPDPIELFGGINPYAAITNPFAEYDRYGL